MSYIMHMSAQTWDILLSVFSNSLRIHCSSHQSLPSHAQSTQIVKQRKSFLILPQPLQSRSTDLSASFSLSAYMRVLW